MTERKYKDSGTMGIGAIPQSWDSQQLGVFFSENKKANAELKSVTALQFKYGEIIQKASNGRELSEKDKELLSKYTVIEPNDIIVNGLNLNFDLKSLRIAIARENGIITSAYIVLRPRQGVNSEYYNYLLKALDFQKILHGMGEGIRLTLSYDELKKLNVPSPDKDIQAKIVSFLDKKCGEIDSLIALQEQMIERLKAYKQSVITEAVTKGLDPDAKLVPSGIDWIGDIPEGWKIMRMKFIGSFQNGLTYSPHEVCGSEGVLVLRSSNIKDSKLAFEDNVYVESAPEELMVNKGDIIICSRNGSASLVGKCALVENKIPNCSFGAFMVRFRSNINSNFAYYLISTVIPQYKQLFTTTTINQLTKGMLSAMMGVLPTTSEQRSIASYLDTKCADIDALIAIKQQKIETLKDYKKSVIYEAVTGKTEIN